MLIDTHCHLVDSRYEGELSGVIERAKEAGVTKMICPGTDEEMSLRAIEVAKTYPGVVFAMVGIHPEEIGKYDQISKLEQLIKENREWVVGVGEIGTEASTAELVSLMGEQKELLRAECELALEYELPLMIHTRDSMSETLEVLDQLPKMPRGQFHCWSDSDEALEEVLGRGFYVGFCGNVTYKANEHLREQAKRVPMDRLLIETDAPYLPPIGKRGERNEPINVRITAEVIAEVRGITLRELGELTSENVKRLYEI